ncbi:MAG: 4-alpha-glucanotransferase, partial [Acidimicrobiia bacterium]
MPGRFGIGELGRQAEAFAEALFSMGQGWWQMLPIGPTGHADSPYQSPSSFAGNHLLVSLDRLMEDGLLDRADVDVIPPMPSDMVEFGAVIPSRMRALNLAADRFLERADSPFEEFCRRHGPIWLDEYALFMALKAAHGGRRWTEWHPAFAARRPEALAEARGNLAGPLHRVKVHQFLFQQQWDALREACRRLGIGLIGDLPIFAAHDSADVWADRELFQLDQAGDPTVVAGVPPDYFSTTGQRWGNPLYRWEAHRSQGFRWWKERARRVFELFDLVRIDHFRGFLASWEVPASHLTAVGGSWAEAPGAELLEALQGELGKLPVIAEDLGTITKDVHALREAFRLPGMRVLQFALTHRHPKSSPHWPDNWPVHSVGYT